MFTVELYAKIRLAVMVDRLSRKRRFSEISYWTGYSRSLARAPIASCGSATGSLRKASRKDGPTKWKRYPENPAR
jgi:hypothetical protein